MLALYLFILSLVIIFAYNIYLSLKIYNVRQIILFIYLSALCPDDGNRDSHVKTIK